MQVISKIQKVKSIPLGFSINKLFEKLFSFNKTKILYNFEIKNYNKNFNLSHNSIIINKIINLNNLIDYDIINNILLHKFDLLGLSNTLITHHTNVNGFENIKYDNNIPFFKSLNEVCDYLISDDVRDNSLNLVKLISDDYQLIDWQIDVQSGYRWSEKIESKNIQIGAVRGADIKVPWELARLQHLPLLAIYYTRNPNQENFQKEHILKEFCNQILDFIAFNPINYGVNWKVAMEVSIRTVNLIFAY